MTTPKPARLAAVAVCGALGACAGGMAHQDAAIRGTADWVIVSYVGDVNETVPIARQHCAQYERIPVFRQTKDNSAVYGCVRPGSAS